MDFKVYINDVIEDIYALTAMSTVAEQSNCPLLHPAHRDALALTVRDSLGILLGLAPRHSISLVAADTESFTFTPAEGIFYLTAAEVVRSALCHITVWVIRRAAGLTKLPVPDFFLTLLTPTGSGDDPSASAGTSPGAGDDTGSDDSAAQEYSPATITPYA